MSAIRNVIVPGARLSSDANILRQSIRPDRGVSEFRYSILSLAYHEARQTHIVADRTLEITAETQARFMPKHLLGCLSLARYMACRRFYTK